MFIKQLTCARHYSKHFASVNSFNPYIPDEKAETRRKLLAKGHRGVPKQTEDSTPGCMTLGTTLLHCTVRGWAVGTIETYTQELNEIIKVIG